MYSRKLLLMGRDPKKFLKIVCITFDLWTTLVHWVIDTDARSIICGPNETMFLDVMTYVGPFRVSIIPPVKNGCQPRTTTIF